MDLDLVANGVEPRFGAKPNGALKGDFTSRRARVHASTYLIWVPLDLLGSRTRTSVLPPATDHPFP